MIKDIYLEIRAAEGGDDSKLLVIDMADAYKKLARHLDSKCIVTKKLPGAITLKFTGKQLDQLHNEAGGHRFQRVPPTETKGRVHTSTITVAVMDSSVKIDDKYTLLDDRHFKFEPFKSSGAGGQHRNKTESGIKCIHVPTGLKQERTSKNQHKNRKDSKQAVIDMISRMAKEETTEKLSHDRKIQVGSGMRGDKIRTYRSQDDQVQDHITCKKTKFKKLMKTGNFKLLWS